MDDARIAVPAQLRHPHHLVANLRELATKREEPSDWRTPLSRDHLRPLDVSSKSLSRALRIMQALLTEAERRHPSS